MYSTLSFDDRGATQVYGYHINSAIPENQFSSRMRRKHQALHAPHAPFSRLRGASESTHFRLVSMSYFPHPHIDESMNIAQAGKLRRITGRTALHRVDICATGIFSPLLSCFGCRFVTLISLLANTSIPKSRMEKTSLAYSHQRKNERQSAAAEG